MTVAGDEYQRQVRVGMCSKSDEHPKAATTGPCIRLFGGITEPTTSISKIISRSKAIHVLPQLEE